MTCSTVNFSFFYIHYSDDTSLVFHAAMPYIHTEELLILTTIFSSFSLRLSAQTLVSSVKWCVYIPGKDELTILSFEVKTYWWHVSSGQTRDAAHDSSVSTHLFQESPLRLVIEANQLLHHHHLSGLPVGHLLQDSDITVSDKQRRDPQSSHKHSRLQFILQDCHPLDKVGIHYTLHTFSKVSMHVALTGQYENMPCLTLMACPKQPFPSTSPWMRSDGRKMRCVRLDTTRSDSDRLMSFLWEMGEAALLEPGDLSML